jgi:hypothetical protein
LKIRNKISISLILFTVVILVAQIFVEQVTIYSKLTTDIEEVADFNSDLDDSNENNSDEGSEENMNEGVDKVPFELCRGIYLYKIISDNKIHKDRKDEICSFASEIFDTPPELEV